MLPYRLPIEDTGCLGNMRVSFDITTLVLEFEYSDSDGIDHVGSLEFDGISAFRFRGEMYSAGFVNSSFNAVVEIPHSAWIRELSRVEPSGLVSAIRNKKHFAVFMRHHGYFEAIAENFEVGPARKGSLSKAR